MKEMKHLSAALRVRLQHENLLKKLKKRNRIIDSTSLGVLFFQKRFGNDGRVEGGDKIEK